MQYDWTNPEEWKKHQYDWTNPDEWKKYAVEPQPSVWNTFEAERAAYAAGNIPTTDNWQAYLPEGNYAGSSLAGEIDGDTRVLTIEEQREVAFKVVFFFIGLIAASFGVLYIYHRMTQANIKSVREKQTL